MRIHPIPALLCLAVAALGVLPATASPTPSQALKADAKVAKPAAKAPGPAPAKADAPLLPTSFSGWEAGSAAKPATDPAQIDATSAAALKEYGFTDGLVGDYTRGGETLHVKALRFVAPAAPSGPIRIIGIPAGPRKILAQARPLTTIASSSGRGIWSSTPAFRASRPCLVRNCAS
jgi:hypothetical protein